MKRLLSALLLVALAACSPSASGNGATGSPTPSSSPSQTSSTSPEAPMSISLSSTAFTAGSSIPVVYSCKGRSISPPLAWDNGPAGTKSFTLIMDDPDAPIGTFVHWVIYNIPAESRGLAENIPANGQLSDGTLQGNNGAGRPGYTGPCPPSGTHRYFFKLYALDSTLSLPSGAGKDQLLQALQGHILAQAELMGTFSK